jgi:hypothetical protein
MSHPRGLSSIETTISIAYSPIPENRSKPADRGDRMGMMVILGDLRRLI